MRKHYWLLLLCLGIARQTTAQQPHYSNDSIYSSLQQIKIILDEKNYTRIPNKDFENILVQKVSSTVNAKFELLYWIVGVISFIIGATLVFSAKAFIKDNIQSQMTDRASAMKENITAFFKNDVTAIRMEIESKLKEVTQKLENADAQLADARKELLKIRVEKILNEIDKMAVTEDTFQSLMKSLRESESYIDNKLTEQILSNLSEASYYLGKETNMEKIVQQFIPNEKIKMGANIFINLASGFLYNYYSTQDDADKQKCLYYINESLRRLRNYGEAYALKLELLMIDYSRNSNPVEKQAAAQEAEDVFTLVKQLTQVTVKEAVGRFDRVRPSKIEGTLIGLLESNFGKDMEEIRKLAEV